MKFGIFDHIDANGLPLAEQYAQRLKLVTLYEELGFDCYHLAEHHATQLGMAPSPSLFLSAVAQRTTTLKFGPLVYLLPLHHPVRLLEEIGMLDQLSGGRLQLGVGPGGQPAEHSRFGVKGDDVRPMFEEVLDILLKGLRDDVLEYHGRFYQLERVPMLVRPVQSPRPPLWYGTSSPERAEWAAEHRVNLVTMMPNARARTIVEALDQAWVATTRPKSERPLVGLLRNVIIADSDTEARRIAERVWKSFVPTSTGWSTGSDGRPSRSPATSPAPRNSAWPSPDRRIRPAPGSKRRSATPASTISPPSWCSAT
jgi:alkanesulfonate monooxygenase SsuD/methylene tetrahydromethanopterin reductase-like flavin-dependent oxidoreductase (luciferase family)